jgi:F420H(2)-dependent quinone reductase
MSHWQLANNRIVNIKHKQVWNVVFGTEPKSKADVAQSGQLVSSSSRLNLEVRADSRERRHMAKYVPSPYDWVREQVDLYESSGGTKGTTLRDTGLPVVIVTHRGQKTGAIRKTPLMRVKDGDNYVLVGSQGGAPKDPAWVHNLRAEPHIELRDETIVRSMRVREVKDEAERARLWTLAVAAYPPYAEYQARTKRQIPVFVAEP